MSLGKVIKKYRKIKNLTQEEMAARLGVTAPAVNKWENENSYPDITLLAPIARLLDISTDTLLSFREELTMEEINEIVREADARLKESSYEEVFVWAKKKLEQYPNCDPLILNIAVILDAWRMVKEVPNETDYDEYICSLYIRVLDSNDETVRTRAADSLIGFYMRKDRYDKAEEYLEYLSIQNPERKRKQAQIYSGKGQVKEAYKAYEELLFAEYTRVSAQFHGIYTLALKNNDMQKACMIADKQAKLARCFDMGRYYEISNGLEIAALNKDTDTVLSIMEEMLSEVENIRSFSSSPLYEHMEFKEDVSSEFMEHVKGNLRKTFREDKSFAFLKDNVRWQEIVKE